MKKIIFFAAFIFILCGYAAAQNSSTKSKQATKEEKATVKKGSDQKKKSNAKTSLKQESSSNAKSDTVKLKLPVPKMYVGPDTTNYPMNRH